ncbi:hypothetical protein AVEN_107441-1 [Araneus ventricosus]|uniref:Uncharacterized protein n=1 Tax=Araneus ventricosus TaxID=182803 RepID=A0A4Y2FID8_ARAVE|nr:hypothetical protein AVEN_107441-1 [Araneus ventricosus]
MAIITLVFEPMRFLLMGLSEEQNVPGPKALHELKSVVTTTVDSIDKDVYFRVNRDGKEDVKDEPRSGRPTTSTIPGNIERVRQMLEDDRRLSLRMIAEELKISLDSVSNIIQEHLQKRKKNVYAFPTLHRSSNV